MKQSIRCTQSCAYVCVCVWVYAPFIWKNTSKADQNAFAAENKNSNSSMYQLYTGICTYTTHSTSNIHTVFVCITKKKCNCRDFSGTKR